MFTIYTQPNCNFCTKAKDLLNMRGEPFLEVDISQDERAKEKIKRQAKRYLIGILSKSW